MRFDATQKKYLGLALLILIWLPFHEVLHYSVCRLASCYGYPSFNFFNMNVVCLCIASKSIIIQYIYYTIPYILELAIVLIFVFALIRRIKINPFLQTLPYVALFDSFGNYSGSAIAFTDFYQIAKLSPILFWLSAVFVYITIVGTFWYFMKSDYSSVKKIIL